MNKISIAILGVIVAVFLGALLIYNDKKEDRAIPSEPVSNEADTAVRTMVADFGLKLKNVSLLAPAAQVKASMQENYASYLSPELLEQWQSDPSSALGRQTSSPWPDRIEVVSVVSIGGDIYTVDGNVIEVTSADKPMEPAAIYPVKLSVENRGGKWLITSTEKGSYSELPERVTIEGVWECLPHKDQSGPQTMECAFGIMAQDGKHYAIDTRLISTYPVDFPTKTRVKVEGLLVPANQLNSNAWQIYPISGIISATAITKI